MRSVLITAGAAAAAVASYYLYQRQLGAIPFFILSIFFFYRAYGQFWGKKVEGSNRRNPDNGREKRQENNR